MRLITMLAIIGLPFCLASPVSSKADTPTSEKQSAVQTTQGSWNQRDDWKQLFERAQVDGTIVVVDERDGKRWAHNAKRANKRYGPASTFKIPHALFALDAGVVKNEFQVFAWDGTKHNIPTWNQDQTLRSSMRHSTVWVYRQLAREIGADKEQAYVKQINYGNQDASGQHDMFWLNGTLTISAAEQLEFLQNLYRNQLPFSKTHQLMVKDMMINEAGSDWVLRAKTGWNSVEDPYLGWYVGWVEQGDDVVFFALNIDMPNGKQDAPKRKSITRAVLKSLKALP